MLTMQEWLTLMELLGKVLEAHKEIATFKDLQAVLWQEYYRLEKEQQKL